MVTSLNGNVIPKLDWQRLHRRKFRRVFEVLPIYRLNAINHVACRTRVAAMSNSLRTAKASGARNE